MECNLHGPACTGCNCIALVGHANVGKSVLFHHLTGRRAMVSNYPGTTVEIARGEMRACPFIALDTPGVITLPSQTEDERVTERVLFDEPLRGVLQVGDAKNLARTLLLTLQLSEMGIPMVLALNMMDEASSHGVQLEPEQLERLLDLPVVPTVAVRRLGVDSLMTALNHGRPGSVAVDYPADIESVTSRIRPLLPNGRISRRGMALLYLSGDAVAEEWLGERLNVAELDQLAAFREELQSNHSQPLAAVIQHARWVQVERLVELVSNNIEAAPRLSFSERLGTLAMHPLLGLPILAAVLLGLHLFVGVFGAQTLVEFLEHTLFATRLTPWLEQTLSQLLPAGFWLDLFVGEFGLWSMGMTYALALILPIVTTFFVAFGVLEDSGYFSRLAALANRWFTRIGLNGKAVLPMVLGLGCVTMATLTTRTLESKRERLLVTLLLALAVPCSAQLGVVMGMLAGISLGAVALWAGVVLAILLAVGWLANRVLPGSRAPMMLELPPMRLPLLSNVLMKTLARLEWYLREVIPLFLLGTAVMFVLDKTGVLPQIISASQPLTVAWLGLPAGVSAAFLLGFLRRDFGAAGLFVMSSQGLLTPLQTLVAIVTITLFIPCVASIFMIAKERGWRTAAGMVVVIFPLAFFLGGVLQRVLVFVGWGA